jgi:nitrate reductase gamma subunit
MWLMGVTISLLAVLALVFIAYLGVAQAGLERLFGVWLPVIALITFLAGIAYRVLNWARSAVPFRIPTTCGQEKSLPWIKTNKIDNPTTTGAVVLRMVFEILLFRSLFRNTRLIYTSDGPKIRYGSDKWLWLGAIAFHYAFLAVILWHFRFFMEPVPFFVPLIEAFDGFLEVGLPGLMISGVVLFLAGGYLFFRRVYYPQIRYISLLSDYFPLFLIMGIAATGILMRYFIKVDVVKVKELTMSLIAFQPVVPEGIGSLFYIHTFLVCVLLAYFPYSKLMHMGGVFLSPTRNLANNSRMVRHVNPWNYPVKTHSYDEYEDEFREQMIEAGVPVERQPPPPAEEAAEPADEPAPENA